ncbi:MAG: hypothetical protein DRP62_06125 [Planctomycetota bacterium]|nr:MAG: hypothetical protein DRP62_06125 [Planctomycetota bacterium]
MSELKGQLTLEYLISFVVFIGLVVYIYLLYSKNIPSFVQEVEKEEVRSKVYQLSELLINDPGEPDDWDVNPPIERIGLSDQNTNKPNLISKSKIDKLNNTFDCSVDAEYDELQDLFALNRQFSINISDIDQTNGQRTELFVCMPRPGRIRRTGIESKVTRITAYNDSGDIKLAEVIVKVW